MNEKKTKFMITEKTEEEGKKTLRINIEAGEQFVFILIDSINREEWETRVGD